MKLRILHCLWNVGAHPSTLARFERNHGHESRCVELVSSKFGFPADETLLSAGADVIEQERARWRLLWRAAREFDVIHLNFGQTIIHGRQVPVMDRSSPPSLRRRLFSVYWKLSWMADLPILKALGKTIVITYQGDDARQGDFCRNNFAVTLANYVDYYTPQTDEWKRRSIRRAARFADRIYALNPDLMHVLPASARFFPYANVDLSEWQPIAATDNERPLVIHAPTHRAAKGTDFILKAVECLRAEGVAFDFVLVENMTRAEARELYRRADLLVDQLLAGWYGGLAVELMALGKPVVSYIRTEDLKFIPTEMASDIPVIGADPSSIEHVLRELLTTRCAELKTIGQRSRKFVETWHDPSRLAAAALDDYASLRNS